MIDPMHAFCLKVSTLAIPSESFLFRSELLDAKLKAELPAVRLFPLTHIAWLASVLLTEGSGARESYNKST